MASHPNRVGANSVTIFATPQAAENVGEVARAALGHPFKVRVIKSAVTSLLKGEGETKTETK